MLFLSHRFPFPPDRGDRIRSYNVLRELAAAGAKVSLGCVTQEPTPAEHLESIRRLCEGVAAVNTTRLGRAAGCVVSLARGRSATEGNFWSRGLARKVSGWAEESRFDAVYCFCSGMYPYTRLPGLRNTPQLVDLVDVDSRKWADCAERSSGWAARLQALESRRVGGLERRIAAEAAKVFVISNEEREVLRGVAPGADAVVAANGVDADYFALPSGTAPDPETCVFVGVLNYQPNVDAMCWFVDAVWPLLKSRRPAARLRIVGRTPSPAVRRLGDAPGIEIVASPPDVRPLIAQSAVAVAPLRIARGVQNKVLEAMAMQRPVVASGAALTGISATPGEDLLRAESPEDWANVLIGLFDAPDRREQMGRLARSYVLRRHVWKETLRPIIHAATEIAERRQAQPSGQRPIEQAGSGVATSAAP
ncbi:TIGR03087 family PEP-CTERM/XrtA system glycosyltransferase [Botrimarina sp.]|uniref:TIGR03087 family PEP-CTERM/XrtA system glycosyltransferase n=1 Tax=Botrimarina sp. TaxID=2795802 RepID=UPI0032EF333E